jgi:hypothetical protein
MTLGGFLTTESEKQCFVATGNLKYRLPQIVHSYCEHLDVSLQEAGDIHML